MIHMEIWGVAAMSSEAAKALGERNHVRQVRAVVLVRSRIAAARAFAAAGLYSDVGRAERHLTYYGATSSNEREKQVCILEDEVFVTNMNATPAKAVYLRWSGKS